MDVFVESLLRTDKVICDNIDKRDVLGDDLLVQNIVAQLRHFVEGIARLICSREQDIANNQKGTEKAIKLIKSREDLVFLRRFHQCLQVSAAHSTVDPDAAMRLMHRYWDYLQDCKEYVQKMFGLELLHNIDKFPLEQDETLKEYYEKIAIEVNKRRLVEITESPTDRYYVHKKKTFRVNGEKFYEITLSQADDKSSKFDNVIVFTKINIPTFYALHPRIVESSISILGRRMSIRIVTGFKVSVRPCEFDNFFRIFGHTTNTSTSDNEYRTLMDYLTITKLSLTELVDFDDEDFVKIKERVCSRLKATHIFDGLEKCREYRGKPGYNILIYLLHRLRNKVIKDQYYRERNERLSNLRLKYECIGFDTMPFAFELSKHFTDLGDLFACISCVGREHELLARRIKNNTEIHAKLYTSVRDLEKFEDIEKLISKYNSLLYYKHRASSSLKLENGFVFISGYENNTIRIIQRLIDLSSEGLIGYEDSFEQWLKDTAYVIDSDEKKNALCTLFKSSKVALIYGSAGTGKSTMVKHISNFFQDRKKVYLANTHAAKENLGYVTLNG